MTMADTVAVMNQGRIEQMGAPAALYDLPHTSFVANFLGQANIVVAKVVDDDGAQLNVSASGRHFWTPTTRVASTAKRSAGTTVAYGVRPEKLRLHESEPAPGSSTAIAGPGTLTDVSFTGVSTQYLVDLPGLGTWGVFEQNLDVEPIDSRPGDTVWVTWNQAHSFVVPADGMTADDNGMSTITPEDAA